MSSDRPETTPGELYPGQFADLQPLPEWARVSGYPGYLRTHYRGFDLETRPGTGGQWQGLINGSVRESHSEGEYLRFLLIKEAARMAKGRANAD